MNLSSSAIYDIKCDICPVEACQHCQIGKVYIFKEDLFSIE